MESIKSSKGVSKKQYLDFLSKKRQTLEHQIEFLSKRILRDFEQNSQHSNKLLKIDEIKNEDEPNISYENLIDKTIPFCDNYNRISEKISNLTHHKKFLNKVCLEINNIAKQKISKKELQEGKQCFDTVCDYTKRKKESITNTKELYKEPLCKYLMLKTFRKSAVDTFQSVCRIESGVIEKLIGVDTKVRLGCLGGGPGSDLTGLLSYFLDMDAFYEFECTIYDSQAEYWSSVSNEPINSVLNKSYQEIMPKSKTSKDKENSNKITVCWEHIDFDDPSTVENLTPDFKIVSICWALNETNICKEFWQKTLNKLKDSQIVIIEGEREPLVKMIEVLNDMSRKYSEDLYESPRRLIIYPSS